jgi:hypothetical protein
MQGLCNFNVDWSGVTEDVSNEVCQQPVEEAAKIERVCPPPGFTVEDRNHIRNDILFEDLLAQHHAGTPTDRMQNLAIAEKINEIVKLNEANIKMSESEASQKTAQTLQMKVTEIVKKDEKPKFGAKTVWHNKIVNAVRSEDIVQVSHIPSYM